MARILEVLTLNVAVRDLAAAVAKYQALGLTPLPAAHMPDPPAQITDVSIPLGAHGHLSLIAATDPASPVARFIAKRGEGAYSLAVRVDNLRDAMDEWSKAGLRWVLPEPYEFPPNTPAVQYAPERLLANWVAPSSLNGLMLEVFEFQGHHREAGREPAP